MFKKHRSTDIMANLHELEMVSAAGDTYKIYAKGKAKIPENLVAKIQGEENAKMFCHIGDLFKIIRIFAETGIHDVIDTEFKDNALKLLDTISTSDIYYDKKAPKPRPKKLPEPEPDEYEEEEPSLID